MEHSKEMSELEIANFAYNFTNLINDKNRTIRELQREVKILTEQLRTMTPVKLTKDEVLHISCPVWVVPQGRKKDGFYALPTTGGVTTGRGIYSIHNYENTWVAYSARPIDTASSDK